MVNFKKNPNTHSYIILTNRKLDRKTHTLYIIISLNLSPRKGKGILNCLINESILYWINLTRQYYIDRLVTTQYSFAKRQRLSLIQSLSTYPLPKGKGNIESVTNQFNIVLNQWPKIQYYMVSLYNMSCSGWFCTYRLCAMLCC